MLKCMLAYLVNPSSHRDSVYSRLHVLMLSPFLAIKDVNSTDQTRFVNAALFLLQEWINWFSHYTWYKSRWCPRSPQCAGMFPIAVLPSSQHISCLSPAHTELFIPAHHYTMNKSRWFAVRWRMSSSECQVHLFSATACHWSFCLNRNCHFCCGIPSTK